MIEGNPDSQLYLCSDSRKRHELQRLRLAIDAEDDWTGTVYVGYSGPGTRVGSLVIFGDASLIRAYLRSLR